MKGTAGGLLGTISVTTVVHSEPTLAAKYFVYRGRLSNLSIPEINLSPILKLFIETFCHNRGGLSKKIVGHRVLIPGVNQVGSLT